MKDKLSGALGGVGVVLWYIVSFLYSFAPLLFLKFPFWLDFILIVVMSTVPLIGEIVRFALYIWAFVVVLNQPIDAISIVFFVFAALYFFTTIVPIISALFSKK